MSKKISKKLYIPLILIILSGFIALGYIFRGTENSVVSEKATYHLTADELFTAFDGNESTANEKYLGKVIEVTGKVREIEKTANGQLMLLLDSNSPTGGVRCTFETKQDKVSKQVNKGNLYTIKGKCSGFLMEVVLDNCSLSK